MRSLFMAAVAATLSTGAPAQFASEQPLQPASPTPPTRAYQPKVITADSRHWTPLAASSAPPGAIAVTPDRRSWIMSVDGKVRGLAFRLGSSHVIRGHGLTRMIGGSIMGLRLIPRTGPHVSTRYQSIGSSLRVKVINDDQLIATVMPNRLGELPWRSDNGYTMKEIDLTLGTSVRAQAMRAQLFDSAYTCTVGEPNCA